MEHSIDDFQEQQAVNDLVVIIAEGAGQPVENIIHQLKHTELPQGMSRIAALTLIAGQSVAIPKFRLPTIEWPDGPFAQPPKPKTPKPEPEPAPTMPLKHRRKLLAQKRKAKKK